MLVLAYSTKFEPPKLLGAREAFSRNLKQVRGMHGMSQEDLADELNVDRTLVSRYEKGGRVPDITMARRMAEALKVPVTRLLYQWDEMYGPYDVDTLEEWKQAVEFFAKEHEESKGVSGDIFRGGVLIWGFAKRYAVRRMLEAKKEPDKAYLSQVEKEIFEWYRETGMRVQNKENEFDAFIHGAGRQRWLMQTLCDYAIDVAIKTAKELHGEKTIIAAQYHDAVKEFVRQVR